ncbi:MAG: hypothetical protein AAF721_26805, partial [Myxococcota bacterium]
LRREQVTAGVKGKNCLQGRVDAGTYEVHGLSLVNHEGATMATRVDHAELPDPIRSCIAKAFQTIRLPRDPAAFVRPVAPVVSFTVDNDGTVGVKDEEWLRMVELEERAQAAKRKADQGGGGATRPVDELPATRPGKPSMGAVGGAQPTDDAATGARSDERPAPETTPDPAPEAADPGEGGLRLNLGGRGE